MPRSIVGPSPLRVSFIPPPVLCFILTFSQARFIVVFLFNDDDDDDDNNNNNNNNNNNINNNRAVNCLI